MPILSSQVSFAGLSGIRPNLAFIKTNDTVAIVTATGYLTNAVHSGLLPGLENGDMCLVSTQTSEAHNAPVATAWYQVSITGLPGDLAYSLVIPTETDATFNGFILINAPGNAGSFTIQAIASTGDFDTILANSNMGQNTTVVIPDPGNANGQLLIAPGLTPFTNGHLVVASGTHGVVVDAGYAIISATTAAYGGGATTNTFTATGLTAASIVTASNLTSTNSVSITKAVPGTNTLAITWSADPGAGTTVNWIATTAAA